MMAPNDLSAWAANAAPGAVAEYYRGDLVFDRDESERRQKVTRLADRAWELYDADQVLLVQRKHGWCDYAYLAVRRGR